VEAVLIPVITAVVGGVIFLLTRAYLARRERLVAGRAAARLVVEEITDATSFIESSLHKRVWLDTPGM
jgi:hypothetical protein